MFSFWFITKSLSFFFFFRKLFWKKKTRKNENREGMADPRTQNGTVPQGIDKRSTHYLRHIQICDDVLKKKFRAGPQRLRRFPTPHPSRRRIIRGWGNPNTLKLQSLLV